RVGKKKRIFIYFIMVCNGKTYIRQRRKNDIWKGLFEPPAVEITGQTNYNIQTIAEDYFKESFSEPPECTTYRQQLTHQSLEIHFVTLPYRESLFKKFEGENMRVNISELSKFAFPKTISLHFKKIGLL
ncbi:MAG: NUDIX domain-containing protein, partial [Chitinophagales bacterium]|nr:NUDIX domain-containing protein [Chitinophagales bacterium]